MRNLTEFPVTTEEIVDLLEKLARSYHEEQNIGDMRPTLLQMAADRLKPVQEVVPEGAVKIGDHIYPDRYPPGVDPSLDKAWEILDAFKPGVLSLETRSFLAGSITGALLEAKRK